MARQTSKKKQGGENIPQSLLAHWSAINISANVAPQCKSRRSAALDSADSMLGSKARSFKVAQTNVFEEGFCRGQLLFQQV
jgi:hypothetical protein